VLRRIFGPKRNEIEGGWKKLHNKELHNLYFSPNIMIKSRRIGWARLVAVMGENKNSYSILVIKKKSRRLGGPTFSTFPVCV
jgi:hypothetical protein